MLFEVLLLLRWWLGFTCRFWTPPALLEELRLRLADSPDRVRECIVMLLQAHMYTYHECVVLELVSKIEMFQEIVAHLRWIAPGHASTHWTHLIEWRVL